jgi:predicted kinase
MKIVIMRGVPGSGKSFEAAAQKATVEALGKTVSIRSTDDQFMKDGVYCFNPKFLGSNHNKNISLVEEDCKNKIDVVIVDNTNIKQYAVNPYLVIAKRHGYDVELKEINTDLDVCLQRNSTRSPDRQVPDDVVIRMHDDMQRCNVHV